MLRALHPFSTIFDSRIIFCYGVDEVVDIFLTIVLNMVVPYVLPGYYSTFIFKYV